MHCDIDSGLFDVPSFRRHAGRRHAGLLFSFNYIHDYQTSQWADYRDQGIYLDEQTSGYTVAHNAMVNAPTNVAQNNTGTNTITDNPTSNSSSVISMAGIEAAYADIKTLTIPVPSF